jgi:hypothetical protein
VHGSPLTYAHTPTLTCTHCSSLACDETPTPSACHTLGHVAVSTIYISTVSLVAMQWRGGACPLSSQLRVRCEQDACLHIHCARHMDTKADRRGRGWGCDVQPGHLLPPSRSYSSLCRNARWVRWGRDSNGSVEHGSMVQDVHFFNHLAARRSTSERARACATTSVETCARSTRTPVILFGSCVSTCVCMKAAHLVTEPRMVCVSG